MIQLRPDGESAETMDFVNLAWLPCFSFFVVAIMSEERLHIERATIRIANLSSRYRTSKLEGFAEHVGIVIYEPSHEPGIFPVGQCVPRGSAAKAELDDIFEPSWRRMVFVGEGRRDTRNPVWVQGSTVRGREKPRATSQAASIGFIVSVLGTIAKH
jgi:hypothetical protein